MSVYTPARYRDVDGKCVPTPWEGHFRQYERVEGVMVPREGEVAWILPEGRLSYWRGRVVGWRNTSLRRLPRGLSGRGSIGYLLKFAPTLTMPRAER